MEFQEKYINPFTDFGFKKLFGEENGQIFLTDFLNQLLPKKHRINQLTYLHSERAADTPEDRKAVFDLYCTGENGERFIVEMQRARQEHFKERMIFYTTFPIRDQAVKGEWKFELKAVYTIAILDFTLDQEQRPGDVLHQIQLRDEQGRLFYDKLTFIYLEMPNFVKKESELTSNFDKWMFLLKNISLMRDKPEVLKEIVFGRFLDAAELAAYTPEERWQYEQSLKHYRDMRNVVTTAYDDGEKVGIVKGRKEGRKEGRKIGKKEGRNEASLEIAANLKADGMPAEKIAKVTGVPVEVIEDL